MSINKRKDMWFMFRIRSHSSMNLKSSYWWKKEIPKVLHRRKKEKCFMRRKELISIKEYIRYRDKVFKISGERNKRSLSCCSNLLFKRKDLRKWDNRQMGLLDLQIRIWINNLKALNWNPSFSKDMIKNIGSLAITSIKLCRQAATVLCAIFHAKPIIIQRALRIIFQSL